jgi:DNA-binding CsgD family transcriptional regulator
MAFLKHKFGLTPAEARLVLRLVAGDTLRVSAAALGIGYETTRTTLKSVFHKTRTCRQAELAIVMIHAMAACRQTDPSVAIAVVALAMIAVVVRVPSQRWNAQCQPTEP